MRSTCDPGGTAGQRRAQARAAKSPRWSAERRGVSSSREAPGVENTAPACRSQARTDRAYGMHCRVLATPGRLRRFAIPSSGMANRRQANDGVGRGEEEKGNREREEERGKEK